MTMPAGNYYVGDLCYVLHNEWDEVCEIMFDTPNPSGVRDGEFTLKDGRRFATYSTQYGDGLYNDQFGNQYPVDAGLIGCILLSDIDQDNSDNNVTLGATVVFESDFETSGGRFDGTDWDGVIRIGKLNIETGDTYECEE